MTLLANMKTDDDVVNRLSMRTSMLLEVGAYGYRDREKFGSGDRADKHRRKLEEAFRLCLRWYRYEGPGALSKVSAYESAYRFKRDLSDRIVRQVGSARVGGIGGLLISWFFGWILRWAAREFVEFIMNPESAAWRASVEGET